MNVEWSIDDHVYMVIVMQSQVQMLDLQWH